MTENFEDRLGKSFLKQKEAKTKNAKRTYPQQKEITPLDARVTTLKERGKLANDEDFSTIQRFLKFARNNAGVVTLGPNWYYSQLIKRLKRVNGLAYRVLSEPVPPEKRTIEHARMTLISLKRAFPLNNKAYSNVVKFCNNEIGYCNAIDGWNKLFNSKEYNFNGYIGWGEIMTSEWIKQIMSKISMPNHPFSMEYRKPFAQPMKVTSVDQDGDSDNFLDVVYKALVTVEHLMSKGIILWSEPDQFGLHSLTFKRIDYEMFALHSLLERKGDFSIEITQDKLEDEDKLFYTKALASEASSVDFKIPGGFCLPGKWPSNDASCYSTGTAYSIEEKIEHLSKEERRFSTLSDVKENLLDTGLTVENLKYLRRNMVLSIEAKRKRSEKVVKVETRVSKYDKGGSQSLKRFFLEKIENYSICMHSLNPSDPALDQRSYQVKRVSIPNKKEILLFSTFALLSQKMGRVDTATSSLVTSLYQHIIKNDPNFIKLALFIDAIKSSASYLATLAKSTSDSYKYNITSKMYDTGTSLEGVDVTAEDQKLDVAFKQKRFEKALQIKDHKNNNYSTQNKHNDKLLTTLIAGEMKKSLTKRTPSVVVSSSSSSSSVSSAALSKSSEENEREPIDNMKEKDPKPQNKMKKEKDKGKKENEKEKKTLLADPEDEPTEESNPKNKRNENSRNKKQQQEEEEDATVALLTEKIANEWIEPEGSDGEKEQESRQKPARNQREFPKGRSRNGKKQ